jgi:YggT family protein
MNPSAPFHWYVDGPSLALAVLSYLLILRLALDLTFGILGNNLIFRGLCWFTDPVVRAVGVITPRVVPGPLVTLCALLWLSAVRIALVQVAAAVAMRRLLG